MHQAFVNRLRALPCGGDGFLLSFTEHFLAFLMHAREKSSRVSMMEGKESKSEKKPTQGPLIR